MIFTADDVYDELDKRYEGFGRSNIKTIVKYGIARIKEMIGLGLAVKVAGKVETVFFFGQESKKHFQKYRRKRFLKMKKYKERDGKRIESMYKKFLDEKE